jgi:hypothetical protein
MDNGGGNLTVLFLIAAALFAAAFFVPAAVTWWFTRSWLWAPAAGALGVGSVVTFFEWKGA